ncbi:MAG: hypothetical protein H0T66_06800 [Geodermatophilaceae bacterium]|jgi:hypothetical protein|nr:hypothetical protein [Geodermatophilaceae bacterium]MDQ3453900.1 hypothetical protein [Actinomycetota bacterium]
MAGLLVVFFPLALLLFMLFMERVEQPLRTGGSESDVEDFLDNARPDEMDTFVRFGLRRALDKLRLRRRSHLSPRGSETSDGGA